MSPSAGAGIDPDRIGTTLQPLGVRFRADKGCEGGLLLVLEDPPAGWRTCTWWVTATGRSAAIWRYGTGYALT